jgi:hypothetical protein
MKIHFILPGEHHLWYEDKYKEIRDWLNIENPSWQQFILDIPVFKPLSITRIDPHTTDNLKLDMFIVRLNRFRCWAWAPWTDTPYHYEWWGAKDQLNRYVAGDQVFRVRELG